MGSNAEADAEADADFMHASHYHEKGDDSTGIRQAKEKGPRLKTRGSPEEDTAARLERWRESYQVVATTFGSGPS